MCWLCCKGATKHEQEAERTFAEGTVSGAGSEAAARLTAPPACFLSCLHLCLIFFIRISIYITPTQHQSPLLYPAVHASNQHCRLGNFRSKQDISCLCMDRTTYGISKTAVCRRNTSYLHLPPHSEMVLSGPNMGRVRVLSILADCVLGQCRYV